MCELFVSPTFCSCQTDGYSSWQKSMRKFILKWSRINPKMVSHYRQSRRFEAKINRIHPAAAYKINTNLDIRIPFAPASLTLSRIHPLISSYAQSLTVQQKRTMQSTLHFLWKYNWNNSLLVHYALLVSRHRQRRYFIAKSIVFTLDISINFI